VMNSSRAGFPSLVAAIPSSNACTTCEGSVTRCE
jgi:hypothetical protein